MFAIPTGFVTSSGGSSVLSAVAGFAPFAAGAIAAALLGAALVGWLLAETRDAR